MHFNLVLAHLSWKLKDLIACRLSVRPSVHKLFTFLPSSPEPPINLNKITCILGRRGFTYSQTKDNSILIKEIIDRDISKLIWWYSHSFIDWNCFSCERCNPWALCYLHQLNSLPNCSGIFSIQHKNFDDLSISDKGSQTVPKLHSHYIANTMKKTPK